MKENIIKGYLGFKGEQGLSAYEVAVLHGETRTETEWVNSLGTASSYEQYNKNYTGDGTSTDFLLPSEYESEHFFVDVYVDGLHKMPDKNESGVLVTKDYEIIQVDDKYKIRFHTAPTNNAVIDVIATQVTATDLPISDRLDSESTNDFASGSKAVYDKITSVQATIPNMSSIVDLIYPVGSIYMSVNTTNPSTIFQGTTWEAVGQGRTLVGAGTGVDSANVSKTFDSGANGGWYNAVVVSHTHSASTKSAGAHNHTISPMTYRENYYTGGGKSNAWYAGSSTAHTNTTGAHTHGVTVNSSGVSGVNRNIQPYLVVNMWVRTA